MVEKYIILADSKNTQPFETPRQLTKINGETLIERTIRLLKQNGIKDITITAHDKRFDNLGAKRYEPLYNDWDGEKTTGYWLSAFPIEVLNEPVCFLFGDVYYSENAIKTIIETQTYSTLFFCTYKNKNKKYIKHHDEPLGYKIVDYIMFKEHIERVKTLKDKGLCCREPIVWELYRSINGQDINVHKMTDNYIAINDESCDIDTINDIILLQKKIGGNFMIKCEVINKDFTLARFDELKNIKRKSKEEKGKLFIGDTFECSEDIYNYLNGNNKDGLVVVKLVEVVPDVNVPKIENVEEALEKIEESVEQEANLLEDPYKNYDVEKPIKKINKKKNSKK